MLVFELLMLGVIGDRLIVVGIKGVMVVLVLLMVLWFIIIWLVVSGRWCR